jgi:hypothetical protein
MNTLRRRFVILIFAALAPGNQQGRVGLAARAVLGPSGSADMGAILRPKPAKISQPNAPPSPNYPVSLVFVKSASRF